MSKYLAIDIGATSGRAIIADFSSGITLEEISRFTIEIEHKDQKQRLNLNKLETDIKDSIKKALIKYDDVKSIGIDTWAVDFVCLDENKNVIEQPMFYRDNSFVKALHEYQRTHSLYELYQKTGIQIQPFNTFFQLNILAENFPKTKVKSILLLPDYLNYVLTGVMNTEYTNATTTQCFGHRSFLNFHYENKLFSNVLSNRRLGKVKPEFTNKRELELISVASHDTGSAHVAIPDIDENTVFISSGTWSLLGIDVKTPITNREAFVANFSNEGSYNGTYRFQKNIMGLWMIVNLAKENEITDFATLAKKASEASCETIIDVNDHSFLSPQNMQQAITDYCNTNNLEVPKTTYDFARVVYRSLAVCYSKAIVEIETITNRKITKIIVVGGGANIDFLNQQLKIISKKQVMAFAYECSALGNALVQSIEMNQLDGINTAHQFVKDNLEFKEI